MLKVAAAKACGINVTGGYKKRSSWWSDELKQIIKFKTQNWKVYIRERTEESYNRYKSAKKFVKDKDLEEKNREWKRLGEKIQQVDGENFLRKSWNRGKEARLESKKKRNKHRSEK